MLSPIVAAALFAFSVKAPAPFDAECFSAAQIDGDAVCAGGLIAVTYNILPQTEWPVGNEACNAQADVHSENVYCADCVSEPLTQICGTATITTDWNILTSEVFGECPLVIESCEETSTTDEETSTTDEETSTTDEETSTTDDDEETSTTDDDEESSTIDDDEEESTTTDDDEDDESSTSDEETSANTHTSTVTKTCTDTHCPTSTTEDCNTGTKVVDGKIYVIGDDSYELVSYGNSFSYGLTLAGYLMAFLL